MSLHVQGKHRQIFILCINESGVNLLFDYRLQFFPSLQEKHNKKYEYIAKHLI